MGKVVVRNQPCLSPSCGSSDARQIYDDGTSFCFSCTEWFSESQTGAGVAVETTPAARPEEVRSTRKGDAEEILTYPFRPLKDREISREVAEFFGVRVSYNGDGQVDTHYYPYGADAWKVRRLPKDFRWVGASTQLFGMDKFPKGGKRVVVTEGEIDAMSVAQAQMDKYGRVYPVVALPSASSVKKYMLENNRDWLRAFDEVVLCLDEDEAGRKAVNEAIHIVGIDKARIVKLPFKDANEVYLKRGGKELLQHIWDAVPYVPSGIIGKDALWEALKNFNNIPSVPYPPCLEGVNTKLKGMRPGEITLFISGTGSGKSTVMREIMLHVLQNTKDKIGVVSLEESPAETARKLAGMQLERNPAETEIPIDDLKPGFDAVFGDDRVVLLDHQGSIDDSSIVDQLEYMCLVGCKYLFIDHITILVSEGIGDLTGNEAQDKMMNDLLRLVKRHPVWIGLVSHLRKSGGGAKSFEEGRMPSIDDVRGSGSIKQISFDIVSFARNLTASGETERNTIKMRILKARHTGLTGPVKGAYYVYKTGRLQASDAVEEFVQIS